MNNLKKGIDKLVEESKQTDDYEKVFNNLKNAGFDVYKDGKSIFAYDDGDAVRDYEVGFNDGKIQMKSIHIDKDYQNKGWGGKLINNTLKDIKPNTEIEIIASINDDFWNHMIKKYPQFKWTYK